MKLQIFDTNNTELKIGDLVKIQHERNNTLTFYTRVQIIKGQIFPFNNFVFDRIIKIDSIPDDCKHAPAKNNFPEYWMHPKQELILIEEKRLDKWKWDSLMFEHNSFYQVSE